jgi:hypothetical protein
MMAHTGFYTSQYERARNGENKLQVGQSAVADAFYKRRD